MSKSRSEFSREEIAAHIKEVRAVKKSQGREAAEALSRKFFGEPEPAAAPKMSAEERRAQKTRDKGALETDRSDLARNLGSIFFGK